MPSRLLQSRFTSSMLVIVFCALGASAAWENISDEICKEKGIFDGPTYDRRTGGIGVIPTTGEVILILCGRGVYKSGDNGESWSMFGTPAMNGRCEVGYGINIHYPYTGRMGVLVIDGTSAITLDNGATWKALSKPGRGHEFGDVDWSSQNPTTMVSLGHEPYTVRLSSDGGQNWTEFNDWLKICLGVAGPGKYLRKNENATGIYQSTDNGGSWQKVSDFTPLGRTPTHYGNTLYWAAREGVIKSENGTDWSLYGTGIWNPTWGPYFGTNENELMVVNSHGFHISRDGAQTWNLVAPFKVIADGFSDGQYNDYARFLSFAWDAVNNIIYASALGGSAEKLQLGASAQAPRQLRISAPGRISTPLHAQLRLPFTVNSAIEQYAQPVNLTGRRIPDNRFEAKGLVRIIPGQ